MGQKIISCLLFTMVLTFALTTTETTRSYAEQSKLAQAIYITVSKACGCNVGPLPGRGLGGGKGLSGR